MKQVEAGWDSMRAGQLLHDVCLVEPHLLSDVITFVALFTKWRGRCKQARLSAATVQLLGHLRRGIVQWLADGLDHYTIHEYFKFLTFISSLLSTSRVWEHRGRVFILIPFGT